jgi:flagella basal body P-ring formation protein FlgA
MSRTQYRQKFPRAVGGLFSATLLLGTALVCPASYGEYLQPDPAQIPASGPQTLNTPGAATANPLLAQKIQLFFMQQYANSGMEVETHINSPLTAQNNCDTPTLSLIGNTRHWGNVSVAEDCHGHRSFIQVSVHVMGDYYVAANNINSGSVITNADVEIKHGRLDNLPAQTITDSRQMVNTVALRNINIGQPLNVNMLRREWMVHAGQDVQVLANGNGFNVSSTGKAISNAASDDSVRVRMPSGQVVVGRVSADGSVHIAI